MKIHRLMPLMKMVLCLTDDFSGYICSFTFMGRSCDKKTVTITGEVAVK